MRMIEIELTKSDLINIIAEKYFPEEDPRDIDIESYDDSLNIITFKVDTGN
jgi:hypothetical protein